MKGFTLAAIMILTIAIGAGTACGPSEDEVAIEAAIEAFWAEWNETQPTAHQVTVQSLEIVITNSTAIAEVNTRTRFGLRMTEFQMENTDGSWKVSSWEYTSDIEPLI